MKTIIVIGGSKGIGKAIISSLLSSYDNIINISRTEPKISSGNLKHYSCDILTDDLPDIESTDGLIYCPGSINLKPINRLSIEDFQDDFNINVIGAVKAIQKYLPALKKGNNPSIFLIHGLARAELWSENGLRNDIRGLGSIDKVREDKENTTEEEWMF